MSNADSKQAEGREGQVVAAYRMPVRQTGFAVPACTESSDDFVFLGTSKGNHLEVVRYVSR